MRLSVINASPRGDRGNTARILEAFLAGAGGLEVARFSLPDIDGDGTALAPFEGADTVLLAFPLYVYSLPAGALRWVARLAARQETLRTLGRSRPVSLAFLVQYGFREACHARDCERQLKRLCGALGFAYGGTVIKGGSEGFTTWPKAAQREYLARFRALGVDFRTRGGSFDQDLLDRFSAPEHGENHWWSGLGNRLFAAAGNRLFWRPQLVRHGALAREADRPLLEG